MSPRAERRATGQTAGLQQHQQHPRSGGTGTSARGAPPEQAPRSSPRGRVERLQSAPQLPASGVPASGELESALDGSFSKTSDMSFLDRSGDLPGWARKNGGYRHNEDRQTPSTTPGTPESPSDPDDDLSSTSTFEAQQRDRDSSLSQSESVARPHLLATARSAAAELRLANVHASNNAEGRWYSAFPPPEGKADLAKRLAFLDMALHNWPAGKRFDAIREDRAGSMREDRRRTLPSISEMGTGAGGGAGGGGEGGRRASAPSAPVGGAWFEGGWWGSAKKSGSAGGGEEQLHGGGDALLQLHGAPPPSVKLEEGAEEGEGRAGGANVFLSDVDSSGEERRSPSRGEAGTDQQQEEWGSAGEERTENPSLAFSLVD